jgi:hypothetical protein
VPVVQTLGHQEWLLGQRGYDRLAEIRSPPRGNTAPPTTICPVDPGARSMMRRLISELCLATGPGTWLHAGGDEPLELGQGRSREVVERDGLGAVYADFYTDLAATVRAWGRRMMVYSDVLLEHPDARRRMPKDVVVVDWHYDPRSAFGSVDTLRREGFDVVACAGLWNWRAFHPDYARAFPNIRGAARSAKRHGGLGAMVTSWGDDGAECLNASNWAGYAYLAACAWAQDEPGDEAFLHAYARSTYGAAAEAIAGVERRLGWTSLGRPWHGRVFARPPTLHLRTGAWRAAMAATRERMLEARAMLDAAEPRTAHHRERLAATRLAVERYGLLADRELRLDGIARELDAGGGRALPESRRIAIAAGLRQCADRTRQLAEGYQAQWLDRSRPQGVAFQVGRLERQAEDFGALERRARAGTLAEWRPRGAARRR